MRKIYDVAVIGGGVIGGTILRELTKYQLSVCLLEAENDVCMGQSKANSGIVHAGFDAKEGTNKAKFNVLGANMMEALTFELGVKYRQNGSIVVAYTDEEVREIDNLYKRGVNNGVKELYVIDYDEIKRLEPNVADTAKKALFAPKAGIVCPYDLTIASIGNAMDNGAELFTDFDVNKIEKQDGIFTVWSKNNEKIFSKIVIDCAGISSQKIANMVGDFSFTVGGKRGEYILLDRESGNFVGHTVFRVPTEKGKGVLVSQTVDNNIIVGPTSVQSDESTATTANGINEVIEKASEMVNGLPLYNSITSFSGVRAYCDKHDFIIEESKVCKNFIILAGIESPGLTSSPAIAKYVTEDIVGKIIPLSVNEKFDGRRKPDYFFNQLSIEEKNQIIKKDPSYGKIVCRCEKITEGEIISAIRTNPKAKNVDAVKRRTRAGMGRCQGGFCQSYVVEILARELNKDFTEITKSGKNSNLIFSKTK